MALNALLAEGTQIGLAAFARALRRAALLEAKTDGGAAHTLDAHVSLLPLLRRPGGAVRRETQGKTVVPALASMELGIESARRPLRHSNRPGPT